MKLTKLQLASIKFAWVFTILYLGLLALEHVITKGL